MPIFSVEGTANKGSIFRANGSIVTLKKISETDWIVFGDLAEGDSEGFPEADMFSSTFHIESEDLSLNSDLVAAGWNTKETNYYTYAGILRDYYNSTLSGISVYVEESWDHMNSVKGVFAESFKGGGDVRLTIMFDSEVGEDPAYLPSGVQVDGTLYEPFNITFSTISCSMWFSNGTLPQFQHGETYALRLRHSPVYTYSLTHPM